MAGQLARVFDKLISSAKSKTTRSFLEGLFSQFEEDFDEDQFFPTRKRLKYVAVTYDRRKNEVFPYDRFDLILDVISRVVGGAGVFKPVHQIRVVAWRSSCTELVDVLKQLWSNDPAIRPYRLLAIPYDGPVGRYRVVRLPSL